ncbi:hypothetical protein GCM10008983_18270 [Lentibacillus halophilus]|uniref:Gram-positive cocci surface proteins LPxTG domain-containing protein n=1 Tax=Lentibacillus halophilus TaxID=295065 RepID=A0ABN0ZB23_9BACI
MQRKLSILFTGMLLFQVIFGNLPMMAQVNAQSEDSNLFKSVTLVDSKENSKDADVSPPYLNIEWGTKDVNLEDNPSFSTTNVVPDGYQIAEKQEGTLTDEENLGTYTAAKDNSITAEVNADAKDASGAFKVKVQATDTKQESNPTSNEDNTSGTDETTGEGSDDGSATNNSQDKNPDKGQSEEQPTGDSSAGDDPNKFDENNPSDNSSTNGPKNEGSSSEGGNQDTATEEPGGSGDGSGSNSPGDKTKEDDSNTDGNNQSGNAPSTDTGNEEQTDTGNKNTDIKENIIDTFTLETKDGKAVEDIEGIDLEEVGKLELALDWSLDNNHGYTNGAQFEFQLPEQFAELSLPDGKLDGYGDYSVNSDGLVTFTFNEKIEQESNIEGYFDIEVELDEQTITVTEDELQFIVNDEVVKRIPVNYEPTGGQAINKRGSHGEGGKFNTKSIDWEVDINTTLESLKGATIKDAINENQSLDMDSIELYEADVDIEGNITSLDDTPVTLGDDNKSSENELKLDLGDTDKAYRLVYTTDITDDEGTEYSNEAVLSSDGKDNASSGATVSVQRQDHLNKSSEDFNKDNHSVDWEVEYNFDEKQLDKGNKLTDEFTFTSKGDDLSERFEVTDIQIEQVDSFNGDGSVNETTPANDAFDKNIDGNKVTYTLNEDTNKPFNIEYTTQLKDDKYITHDGEISNTVTVDGETKKSSQGVYQQVGDKSHSDINYEDKTIEWTIKINQDNRTLNNFNLEDDFSGSGQKLDGSINISPEKSDATITKKTDSDGLVDGFDIDFGTISESYTISYTTKFTYDFANKDPELANKLDLIYETSNGTEYTYEKQIGDTPNDETTSNGAKSGNVDNDSKVITWKTDINYNQLDLKNASFTDPIEDNQSLIDGSVEIYKTSVDSSGDISKGENVTDDYTIKTNDGEKISINFGEINQSYRIEFKTKDKDDIYNDDETYGNTATFEPRNGESHELKAHVTIPHQGEFVGKNGTHNKDEWTVDWEVDINKSESALTDVIVTDDLGSEDAQKLLEDSFELTKNGERLEEGTDYNLDIADNGFTLDGLGDINEHYVLTYSSYILTEETANLTNNAHIKSNEEVTGTTEKEKSIEVKIGSASGGATGETATLAVNKEEKRTNTPVEGVQFQLEKTVQGQDIIVREGKTDENGELNWSGLKYGDYTLHEKVLDNYFADPDYSEGSKDGYVSKDITIDSENMTDNNVQTEEVKNERKTGTVKLIKKDSVTNESLGKAKFKITNQETRQTFDLETNSNGVTGEGVPFGTYSIEEINAPDGYKLTSNIDDFKIEPAKLKEVEVPNDAVINVTVDKIWVEVNDKYRPDAVTVQVKDDDGVVKEKELTTDNDWQHTFNGLRKYDDNGNEIEYKVAEKNLEGYESEIKEPEDNSYEITNTQKTTDISVKKTWYDNNDATGDRPESITIKLMNDGEFVEEQEITTNGDWEYTFKDLAKYNKNGDKINYTVEEVDEDYSDKYKTDINKAEDNENIDFYINNTRVGETSVNGEKIWKDNDDETGDRPDSITVKLLQNGKEEASKEVTAEDNWEYSFKDLERFDNSGTEYGYTIDEEPVDNYEKSLDGNNLINVRTGKTSVSGTKTWKDNENAQGDRPDSIKVNLMQNDTVFTAQEVTKEDGWDYEFTHLPKYDDKGNSYEYKIKEQNVPGYDSEVNDFDLTNTRSETTSFEVTKSWLDDDSSDRPESVEVELFRTPADGEKESVKTFQLSDSNNWSREFEDLPAFTDDGKAYKYSIVEEPVDGYDTTVNGFDITNTRTGLTEVNGEKTWENDSSSDRPETITVNLLQDGEEIDSQDVTAEDNWSYSFTGLAEFDEQGSPYNYTVEEEAVDGYETTVDGYDITNTYDDSSSEDDDSGGSNGGGNSGEPTGSGDSDDDRVDVTGTKTWLNDEASNRPDSITVNLLQNGETIDSVEVSAEDDWEYSFTDLDEFDDENDAYDYTVEEEKVAGYDTTIDGYDITNQRVETTDVTGTKTWENDEASDRPETIKVNLLQNGTVIDGKEISADDDWTYSFTDLETYDNQGETYDYSVKEQDVPGYDSEVNGYDITNTKVETKSINVTKSWLDDNANDRPESVTVDLLQNGNVLDTVDVTADDDWSYTFNNLEAYDDNGIAYEYSIQENNIDGYKTTIDGYDITNTRVGTTTIDVSKQWENDAPEDRPESITVELLQNGNVIDTVDMTADQNWTHTFTELDQYNDKGIAYNYTVREQDAADYQSSINKTDNGYTIINTLEDTPEEDESGEPGGSDESDEPTTPDDSDGTDDPSDDSGQGNSDDTLPQTGEEWMRYLLIAGLLAIVTGGVLLFSSRKRKLD